MSESMYVSNEAVVIVCYVECGTEQSRFRTAYSPSNPPATITAESVAARQVTRMGVEVIADFVKSRTVSSALGQASEACMTLLALE
jgi:hypothetical protein